MLIWWSTRPWYWTQVKTSPKLLQFIHKVSRTSVPNAMTIHSKDITLKKTQLLPMKCHQMMNFFRLWSPSGYSKCCTRPSNACWYIFAIWYIWTMWQPIQYVFNIFQSGPKWRTNRPTLCSFHIFWHFKDQIILRLTEKVIGRWKSKWK